MRDSGTGEIANAVKYTSLIAHFTSRGRKSGDEFHLLFSCPRKKKSSHGRSSDRGDQATGPPHPNHRPGKDTFVATLTQNGLVLHRTGTTYAVGSLWAHLRTSLAIPPAKT